VHQVIDVISSWTEKNMNSFLQW